MDTEVKSTVNKNIGTPYDDAFRTMTNDCSQLLIPMVNEIFGKHYRGDEKIIFHPNEHYLNQQDGNEDKRITDCDFSIIGETEERYSFECQSLPDNSMLVRIFEYVTQIALDAGSILGDTLEVTIPNAAVLFLRSTSSTPDQMKILMHTPGGDVEFGIPVMKIKQYTIESIFEKKLYFLIPVFIFNRESDFKIYEADSSHLEQLKQEYSEILTKLEEAAAQGDLPYYYMRSIIDMTKLVLENIAKKFERIKEGVNSVMGGRILEHESKTIYNEGRNETLQHIILHMYKNGMKAEDIAKMIDTSVNLVEQFINSPVPAANNV